MPQITFEDLALKDFTLDNLPRLAELHRLSFARKPEICIERARHVTAYLKERDKPDDAPEVRQAKKVAYFLKRKTPVFHDRNLLAGSTTSKALGAPLFPEFFALTLWPELDTVGTREKNPQKLTAEEARELNLEIFPFWMNKSVLEVTRQRVRSDRRSLALFEDLVFFIAAKAGCISHAVPTYAPMLTLGLTGLINMAAEMETAATVRADGQADFYRAVQIALNGILRYAENLAEAALDMAAMSDDPVVKQEFHDMAEVCRRVPAITLGGVDEKGEDAVNDLTYLMLRVTELLAIRDPNVNARYDVDQNTGEYCRRVSEVILNTKAVPAFFNDQANIAALRGQGEKIEHARDYAVIGCVELASSGRDYPASSSIMLNLSAPLEMALFGGKRPITGDAQIGPATADPAILASFEAFWEVFKTHTNYRGGPYRPAYWTMTNHAGLGGITGAMLHGRPSYIPTDVVGRVVQSLLLENDPDVSLVKAIEKLPNITTEGQGSPETGQPTRVKELLRTFVFQGERDLISFRKALEDHFDAVMDRASGWVKRRQQTVALITSAFLVLGANVDTVSIATALCTNPEIRAGLISQAEEIVESESTPTAMQNASIPGSGVMPATLDIPLPFWFDLLNRFMKVRQSGVSPTEKKGKDKS